MLIRKSSWLIIFVGLFGFLLLIGYLSYQSKNKFDWEKVKQYIPWAEKKQEEPKMTDSSINPLFETAVETKAKGLVVDEIDKFVKNVLNQNFQNSKLVFVSEAAGTPPVLGYVVEKKFDQKSNNEFFYQTFLVSGSRPKDDSRPVFSDIYNTIEFAVRSDFEGKSYILGLVMDIKEQKIWVNVY